MLEHSHDYKYARAHFKWPELKDGFNWAIDWFDASAEGVNDPALIVLDDNSRTVVTFDEMRRRSNQLAHWLSRQDVAKGHVVLLMLGNEVELWTSMLAIIKLDAIILPTTVALAPMDIVERASRADVRHVIANAKDTFKFADIAPEITRISVGPSTGWADLDDCRAESDQPIDRPATKNGDPLLFYFTSGTTSKPKLVVHSQLSYPVGHLSTMYWLGLSVRPGTSRVFRVG